MRSTNSMMKTVEIPCCVCGTMILPNAANQCNTCLAQEMDLKTVVSRGPGGSGEIVLNQCRQCRRFARTEKAYDFMDPESPELLALCLKQIPALAPNANPRLHLVDAMWIWTEPHSMRFRIRLTVRTEVHNVQIQQRLMVELVNKWKQCPDCNREYTNRTWHAMVQLRQKRQDDAPRKGLTLLEMALARNAQVRRHVINLDTSKQGFDFYFLHLANAQQFASYLAKVAPMRIKTTKKLVSTDVKNNTANMKYTVSCDMVPLCRDDLVVIHKTAKGTLAGRLCLVTKVSSTVHLVDASPKRSPTMDGSTAEIAAETYYRAGADKAYKILSSSRRMTRFVVLDVEMCDGTSEPGQYQGPKSGVRKHALADVTVARESDFGVNDEQFQCVTHLGNLLHVGDVVLGYDLESLVMGGGDEFDLEHGFNSSVVMPDVVLVKKLHGVEKDGVEDEAKEDERKKSRLRSSGSKKRERRRKREDDKQKEVDKHLDRMGFFLDSDRSGDQLEKELANDPELAADLAAAEQELTLISEEETGTEMDLALGNEGGSEEQH